MVWRRRRLEHDKASSVLRLAQALCAEAHAVAVQHKDPWHLAERRARRDDPIEVQQVRVQVHLSGAGERAGAEQVVEADRLVVETDGRFLTEGIAELASHPAPQLWILNGDRAPLSVLNDAASLLAANRHADVAIWRAHTARDGFDVGAVRELKAPIFAGEPPPMRDAIWIRRGSHAHYLADQAATRALTETAAALGVAVRSGADNRPLSNPRVVRTPVVSWDGKVTMDPLDTGLTAVEGDVIHSTFSSTWTR